jgi:hypothetical protein
MGDSGVAMSLGSAWKSSCARLSGVASSSALVVTSEIAGGAAILMAIELFICLKFSPPGYARISVALTEDVLKNCSES